jgi:hypothetical protein
MYVCELAFLFTIIGLFSMRSNGFFGLFCIMINIGEKLYKDAKFCRGGRSGGWKVGFIKVFFFRFFLKFKCSFIYNKTSSILINKHHKIHFKKKKKMHTLLYNVLM